MKQSPRAKRMVRHRMRLSAVPKLNLVPLIDCFTLLIFFLMINYSASVEVLQPDKSLVLPTSVSETAPGETVVVMINANDVIVSGNRVGSISEMMASPSAKFDKLEKELKYLASKSPPLPDAEKSEGRPITIMGDKAIPYEQLKKIMASCVAADYRKIAMAVMHAEGNVQVKAGG